MSTLDLVIRQTPCPKHYSDREYARLIASRVHQGWSFRKGCTVEWFREQVEAIEKLICEKDSKGAGEFAQVPAHPPE
jgi:hypothetical protein